MSMKDPVLWRNTPLRVRIIFLAAVFCVFVGIGVANDIIDMGRWSPLRFALSVALIGIFAIGYAASGVILRNRFWKAMVPLMVVQFATMGFLANRFPDAPRPAQMNAAETDRLHSSKARPVRNRACVNDQAVPPAVAIVLPSSVPVGILPLKREVRYQFGH